MRLAILALSAAAISGCSWAGGTQKPYQPACQPFVMGGHGAGFGAQKTAYTHHYGYAQNPSCVGGVYNTHNGGFQAAGFHGAGFQGQPHATHAYGAQAYGPHAYGAQGYGPQGASFQNYGTPSGGSGFGGAYASGGYAAGMAAPNATTLAATAPYGTSIASQLSGNPGMAGQVGNPQFGNTQFGNTIYASGSGAGQFAGAPFGQAPNVQTVMGAPIYVPQPYPSPYPLPLAPGSACCRGGGGGGAALGGATMPFGVEIFGGREFENRGHLFTKESAGPPDGDYTIGTRVGEIENISYGDAFESASVIGGALSYDVSHSTTLFGSVSYQKSEGKTVENYTTVQPGTWTNQVFTPTAGSSPRGLDGTFTDLETTSIEAGIRQYTGSPHALRGYLGASAGFSHNNEVTFTQTYNDDKSYYGERTFINSGWNPTAAVLVGAELPVGPRAAIGLESGLRWRSSLDTTAESDDRITIPLSLRGRLAF